MKKKNILLIILLIIFSICVVRIEFQNDTFFSIAVGRQIMDTGIDMQEHLTWHEGFTYTYSHWLYDLINLFLFNLAGFKAIYGFVVLMTIITSITLFTVLKKLNKNSYIIPFIMTVVVMILGNQYFAARAQIMSYVLFILEVYFIEKLLDTNKKRYIVGLIIIPIIIANVHAAMWMLYLVFFLPYFAEAFFKFIGTKAKNERLIKRLTKRIENEKDEQVKETLKERLNNVKKEFELYKENLKNKESKIFIKDHKYIKPLIIVFIITIFTGLLTPIGDTPYTYILKTMGGISPQNISELRAVIPIVDISFLLYMVIAILCVASSKVKINLADGFMMLGLIFMSMYSVRCIAYLLFIGSIPLARLIFSYMSNYEYNVLDIVYEKFVEKKLILKAFFAFYMIVVALSVFSEINLGKKFVNEKSYPVEASEYILANLDIKSMRIFNGFNYGSYLEYMGIPVFIDSRSEMYTEQYNDTTVFQDFVDVEKGRKTYIEIFNKYNITHALLPKNNIVTRYIVNDSNYNLIYEDNNFVLYEKI